MGNRLRSMSFPRKITSWHGAPDTDFGFIAITVFKSGIMAKASFQPPGGSGWRKNARVSPISRKPSGERSIPQATRSTVPNKLTKTGIS